SQTKARAMAKAKARRRASFHSLRLSHSLASRDAPRRARDVDDEARLLDDGPVDHLPVEPERAAALLLGLRGRLEDARGALDLLRGRRERLVHDGDLARVDDHLAAVAEVARELGLELEARGVVVVDEDLVDR